MLTSDGQSGWTDNEIRQSKIQGENYCLFCLAWKGDARAMTTKQQQWCQVIHFNTKKSTNNPNYPDRLYCACFHGNSVSGSPWIWTFPHSSINCAYTLFHFLTPAFFLTHRDTFNSPVLSACLSLHLTQCKRLVSRQVLRPIKLSTSLVDLKDTNTKICTLDSHTEAHRHTLLHNERHWQQQQRALRLRHPHTQAERPAVLHSLKLHFWKAASQADSFTQGLQTLMAMVS